MDNINYFTDMKTIDNIINSGNNYDKINTTYTPETFTHSEPNGNNNGMNNNGMNNNSNRPNPGLNHPDAYNPNNMNKFNLNQKTTFSEQSNPLVHNKNNPLFKETPNPFLERMNELNETDSEPKSKNEEPKPKKTIVEDFNNVNSNERRPTVKLFVLGVIITFGFAAALAWHEVSKYYIARSIKFYKGTSLYYIYYALVVSILLIIIMIINHFS